MYIGKMSSFNVLLILVISAITAAYPTQNQFVEYYPGPYFNYVVQPYTVPQAFTPEQLEASPLANYNDLTPFEQLPLAAPNRLKSQTVSYQIEEVKDVIEEVLKLMIDQRLCEIINANDGTITKRSISQNSATRAASTTETNALSEEQLAFLKNLKLEDIKQLIKLIAPALAVNETVPVQQELPHWEPSTFYTSTPVWHPAPLQEPVFHPSLYIQNHQVPFHPFEHQQIISYEPYKPNEEVQFQIMKPYMESPVAPPIVLNRMPPLSSPLMYTIQISAPVPSNQATAQPLYVVPNSQIESQPLPPKPHMDVTSNPQASSILEKLESLFSQSKILPAEETTTTKQVISTEKSDLDLRAQLSNKVDEVPKISVQKLHSSKLKGDAVKTNAKLATDESGQLAENDLLLEAFKAIREKLMKNNACRITTPKRRDIIERPKVDSIRNQILQNDLSRHAIPPASLSGKRHNPPAKILLHKHASHTPLRNTTG